MKKVLITLLIIFILLSTCWGEDINKLIIAFTNDIHGGVTAREATFINPDFPPVMGNVSSQLTYLKRLKEQYQDQGDEFLLIDAGDIFTGTPIGSLSKGEAVVKLMNYLEYDAMAVGNHEFDAGEENLASLSELAEFPFLSCNIVDKQSKELVNYVEPYIIKNLWGIKIAIIGLTTAETRIASFTENVRGVEFLPEAKTLQKYVDKVRNEGADIVIAIVHLGIPFDPNSEYTKMIERIEEGTLSAEDDMLNAIEVAHFTKGIDVMFGGHIHIGFDHPWEDPETHALIFQSYARGGTVGTVFLKIDRETRSIVGYEFPEYGTDLVTYFEEEFWPDPKLDSLLSVIQSEVEAGFDKVIGKATDIFTRGDASVNYAGYLVCDAMKEIAKTDFAICNMGGVRAELPAGDVTLRDVFNVMPFDNSIVTLSVPGSVMVELFSQVASKHSGLLVSGCKVYFDPDKKGKESIRIEIQGEEISPGESYSLAISDYIIDAYNLRYLEGVSSDIIRNSYNLMRDAIAEYIKKHTPVSPDTKPRWETLSSRQ
ncbi:bifunctional metallophosphatase/5'-nucleotidase [bacterium]|nr:bifunctional metallophosphatase/5'-nucleotidase [bacterium]